MNPAIVFDLGKVLVDFDYSLATQKISARSLHPPADSELFANLADLLVDYETGRLNRNIEEFRLEMQVRFAALHAEITACRQEAIWCVRAV